MHSMGEFKNDMLTAGRNCANMQPKWYKIFLVPGKK
jgi:hypothetical protein